MMQTLHFVGTGLAMVPGAQTRLILREIEATRAAGVRVVHRISVPAFELAHLPVAKDKHGYAIFPSDKEKPWKMLEALKSDEALCESVGQVFADLVSPHATEMPFEGDTLAALQGGSRTCGRPTILLTTHGLLPRCHRKQPSKLHINSHAAASLCAARSLTSRRDWSGSLSVINFV